MDQEIKSRLTSKDVWVRALYMIFFAIAYSIAEFLMAVVAVLQFFFILFTGSASEPLLRFGNNLTHYIAAIIRFETFNSEDKPFPFDDFPDEEPGGERWREPAEASGPAADTAVTEEVPVSEDSGGEPTGSEEAPGDEPPRSQ